MYNTHVYSLVKLLGILPVTSGECLVCNNVTDDILVVFHQYELNHFSKDLISVSFYSEKLGQYITEANIYLKDYGGTNSRV
jgi:hypothetical protein